MTRGRGYVLLISMVALAIATSAFDCCADLTDFYITKLFAIETEISVLHRQKRANKDQINKLAGLIRDKRRIEAKLARSISLWQNTHRLALQKPQPTREKIDRMIEEKARKYGINPNFIKALVECESGYDVYAYSRKGAMGLTQLMPETCRDMGIKRPFSPEENLDGGIRYIISLLREFKDVRKALYAYNAGPETIRQGKAIPLETKRFADAVLAHFAKLNSQE